MKLKYESALFNIVLSLLLLLPLNSCRDYTIDELMTETGIPQNINCSFVDKRGNDLVKGLVENNPEIIFEKTGERYKIKRDYYSLKLKVNGTFYPIEGFVIRANSDQSINPTTGKVPRYTLNLSWETLFTEEMLKSKWRDFNIEYYLVFPKLFKDNKEHLVKGKIVLIEGDPTMIDVTFDGIRIEFQDTPLYAFITL